MCAADQTVALGLCGVLMTIAREISGNVETDSGSIDLFLPLDEVVAAPSQYGALEVDLDVSQWPEDAAMSDLLS